VDVASRFAPLLMTSGIKFCEKAVRKKGEKSHTEQASTIKVTKKFAKL
jgi:hypothetical protein